MDVMPLDFRLREIACEACQSIDVYFCQVCNTILCNKCWNEGHVTLTEHVRFPVLKLNDTLSQHCSNHKKPTTLYCIKCNESCCILCRATGSHVQHADKLVELNKWINQQIDELSAKKTDLSDMLFKLNNTSYSHVNNNNSHSAGFANNLESIRDDLHQQFQLIYAILDAHENELWTRIQKSLQQQTPIKTPPLNAAAWVEALIEDIEALSNGTIKDLLSENTKMIPCFTAIKQKLNFLQESLTSSSSVCLRPQIDLVKLEEAIKEHITLNDKSSDISSVSGKYEDIEYDIIGCPTEKSPTITGSAEVFTPHLPNNAPQPCQNDGKPPYMTAYKAEGLTYAVNKKSKDRFKVNRTKSHSQSPCKESAVSTCDYNDQTAFYIPGDNIVKERREFMKKNRSFQDDLQTLDTSSLNLDKPPLKTGDVVVLTFVYTPVDFYVRKLSDNCKMKRMSDHFAHASKQQVFVPVRPEQIPPDAELLVVYYDPEWDFWERVCILPHNDSYKSSGKLPCFRIDKGEYCDIDITSLYRINPHCLVSDQSTKEYLNIKYSPPLSYWCQIDGIFPCNNQGWTEADRTQMINFTHSKNYIVMVSSPLEVNEVRQFNSAKHTVNLKSEDNGELVQQQLILYNIACLQSNTSIKPSWRNTKISMRSNFKNPIDNYADVNSSYIYPIIDRNTFSPLEKVSVVEFTEPDCFWLQKFCDGPDIDKLQEELQRAYSTVYGIPSTKHALTSQLKKGCIVVAQFTDDNTWYRAVIEDVLAPDQYVVRYVDYGNKEHLRGNSIKRLLENFLSIPIMCYCCKLSGVSIPNNGSVPSQLINNLKTYLLGSSPFFASLDDVLLYQNETYACKTSHPLGSCPENPVHVTLYGQQKERVNEVVNVCIRREFGPQTEPIVAIPNVTSSSTRSEPPTSITQKPQLNAAITNHSSESPASITQKPQLNAEITDHSSESPTSITQKPQLNAEITDQITNQEGYDSSRASSPYVDNNAISRTASSASNLSCLSTNKSATHKRIAHKTGRKRLMDDCDIDSSDCDMRPSVEYTEHMLDPEDDAHAIDRLPRFKVCSFKSPHDLFIKQEDNQLRLDLDSQLENYYGRIDNPNRQSLVGQSWPAGTTCMFYTPELAFRRAKLMEALSSAASQEDSIWIVMLDYGKVRPAMVKDLFLLPESLARLYPAQALHCCIAGLKPAGGSEKWSLTIHEKLTEILDCCNYYVKLKGFLPPISVDKLNVHNIPYNPEDMQSFPTDLLIYNEERWPCELIAELAPNENRSSTVFINIGLYLADKGVAFRERKSVANLKSDLSELFLTSITPTIDPNHSTTLNDQSTTLIKTTENTAVTTDNHSLEDVADHIEDSSLDSSWSTVNASSDVSDSEKVNDDDQLYTKDKPSLQDEPVSCQPLEVTTEWQGSRDDACSTADSDGITITARQFSTQPSISYVSQTSCGESCPDNFKWPDFPLPPDDEWENIPVDVIYVDDKMIIYCSTHNYEENIILIDHTLSIVYGKGNIIATRIDWKVGDHCVAKAHFDKLYPWKRGIVTGFDELSGFFYVLLIDTGEVVKLFASLLRPLVNFTDIDMYGVDNEEAGTSAEPSTNHCLPVDPFFVKPCVFRCVLHLIWPMDQECSDNLHYDKYNIYDVEQVRVWVVGQRCRLSIVGVATDYLNDPLFPHTLMCQLVCEKLKFLELGDELSRREISFRYDKNDVDEAWIKTLWKFDNYLVLPLPPAGFVCPVRLLDIEKLNEFFINLDTSPEYFAEYKAKHSMTPEVQEFFESAVSAYNFLIKTNFSELQIKAQRSPQKKFVQVSLENIPCIGQFVDGNWYRAEIINLDGNNKPKVHFVDYGNKEILEWNQVREPISYFQDQPACCRKVKWHRVVRALACHLESETLVGKIRERIIDLSEERFYMKVLKNYNDCRLPLVEFYQDENCETSLIKEFDDLLDLSPVS